MDLSVIVLSYNTKDLTDECLNRLQSSVIRCQTELKNSIEVIVVDNASLDGSAEMIRKKHPWVKLIASKENTGYSRGNNIGIKQASNEIILLLNSDALVSENTLFQALQYFKNNPDCDVLGPRLIFKDGSFQPSAGNLPTPSNIICWILGISLIPAIKSYTKPFHPNYQGFFGKERKVGWISGAFFMVKKEVLEKIGLFDESIFMYLEEVELCQRIKKAGFKIWYVPSITVTHLHGASSKDRSAIFINELRGLKYYFQKHNRKKYYYVRFFLFLGLILRIFAFGLLGKMERAKAYVKGLTVI